MRKPSEEKHWLVFTDFALRLDTVFEFYHFLIEKSNSFRHRCILLLSLACTGLRELTYQAVSLPVSGRHLFLPRGMDTSPLPAADVLFCETLTLRQNEYQESGDAPRSSSSSSTPCCSSYRRTHHRSSRCSRYRRE